MVFYFLAHSILPCLLSMHIIYTLKTCMYRYLNLKLYCYFSDDRPTFYHLHRESDGLCLPVLVGLAYSYTGIALYVFESSVFHPKKLNWILCHDIHQKFKSTKHILEILFTGMGNFCKENNHTITILKRNTIMHNSRHSCKQCSVMVLCKPCTS